MNMHVVLFIIVRYRPMFHQSKKDPDFDMFAAYHRCGYLYKSEYRDRKIGDKKLHDFRLYPEWYIGTDICASCLHNYRLFNLDAFWQYWEVCRQFGNKPCYPMQMMSSGHVKRFPHYFPSVQTAVMQSFHFFHLWDAMTLIWCPCNAVTHQMYL